uniref:C2H2-type domain-containing protein n=1 Tax=viral metagenome TaxID=1070528 RepID=A0A6C0D394_9ZZZZ
MSFECKCCKYKTIYKTNFDKHLLTNKHKKNSEIIDDKPFTCKYCSQKYKYKQSLSKHVKYSCTKNKDEDLKELVRLLNNKIENQDKELKDQSKQIEKLKGKLEININTTVNNIHNFTLLSYTETDTSHLTDTDYKKCIETKNWCVVKMIEKVHFNPKKPENRNLFIPSMKDKYVMVYEDGNWKLNHTKDVIEKLYDEKEELISEWVEIHPDDIDSKQAFDRYLFLKDTDNNEKNKKSLHDQTRVLLYNNRPTKNQLELYKPTLEGIEDK